MKRPGAVSHGFRSNKNKNNLIKNGQKNVNRCFLKEDMQMTNNYMKRCPESLVIRKMQTQTKMRYAIPIRMAAIIKTENTFLIGYWRNWNLCLLVGI
jgi:hypothetical protein